LSFLFIGATLDMAIVPCTTITSRQRAVECMQTGVSTHLLASGLDPWSPRRNSRGGGAEYQGRCQYSRPVRAINVGIHCILVTRGYKRLRRLHPYWKLDMAAITACLVKVYCPAIRALTMTVLRLAVATFAVCRFSLSAAVTALGRGPASAGRSRPTSIQLHYQRRTAH
jgi:hypothetical protein